MNQNVTTLQPTPMPHLGRYAHLIHAPERQVNDTHIPSPALELMVQAFVMQHRSASRRLTTPRTLLIQGQPGTGKTHISRRAILALGAAVAVIPPSIFGSKHEGGGVEAITDLLQELERYSAATRQHIVPIFDDIDASTLSIDDHTGHTTNPTEVIGHLQYLADQRQIHVDYLGFAIPFVATANQPDAIRASAFRHMRAKVHTHTVDDATKLELAIQLFKPSGRRERALIDRLFRRYRREQIAFWPALHSDYDARRIERVIREKGADSDAIEQELSRPVPLDSGLLFELAKNCRAARPGNFLWTRKKTS